MSALKRQLAVALRYNEGLDPAPKMVAKGWGHAAEKIKEVAQDHDIPTHKDEHLAATLEKLDLGAFIPEDLYQAVAEVLAFVYTVNEKLK